MMTVFLYLIALSIVVSSTDGWILLPSLTIIPRGGSQLFSTAGKNSFSNKDTDAAEPNRGSNSKGAAIPSTIPPIDDDPVLRLPLLEAELASLKQLATVSTTSTTTDQTDGEWLNVFREIDDLSAEIKDIKTSAELAVRKSQVLFYEAFSDRDVKAMRQIWSSSKSVRCIHPGMPCITGLDNIMASWEDIFGPPMPPPGFVSSGLPFSSSEQYSPEVQSSSTQKAEKISPEADISNSSREDDEMQDGEKRQSSSEVHLQGESLSSPAPPFPPRSSQQPPNQPQFTIEADQTEVQILGATAIVSCIETIVPERGEGGRGRRGGGQEEDFECLNIYRREDNQWKMLVRMVSPIMMMRGPPGPPPPGFEDGGGRDFGGGRDQSGMGRGGPPFF